MSCLDATIRQGVSGDESSRTVFAFHSGAATLALFCAAPGVLAQGQNPYAGDAKMARLGEFEFRANCAFCHGLGARAVAGPMTRLPRSMGFRPRRYLIPSTPACGNGDAAEMARPNKASA